MKKVLRILNSLVVLTILSTTVIACGNEVNSPPIIPHSDERFRNQIATLEAQKESANDDEIIIIDEKINWLVAEWVFYTISVWHAFDFKIELKQPNSWETILQENIPKCFNDYFSSRADFKERFDIKKIRIFPDHAWDALNNRWLFHYNYDNWTSESSRILARIKIVGSIVGD